MILFTAPEGVPGRPAPAAGPAAARRSARTRRRQRDDLGERPPQPPDLLGRRTVIGQICRPVAGSSLAFAVQDALSSGVVG
jgi:hypothetical protein